MKKTLLFLIAVVSVGCQTKGGVHSINPQKCSEVQNTAAIIVGAGEIRNERVPVERIIEAAMLWTDINSEPESAVPLTKNKKEEVAHLLNLTLNDIEEASIVYSLLTSELAIYCGLDKRGVNQEVFMLRDIGYKVLGKRLRDIGYKAVGERMPRLTFPPDYDE